MPRWDAAAASVVDGCGGDGPAAEDGAGRGRGWRRPELGRGGARRREWLGGGDSGDGRVGHEQGNGDGADSSMCRLDLDR